MALEELEDVLELVLMAGNSSNQFLPPNARRLMGDLLADTTLHRTKDIGVLTKEHGDMIVDTLILCDNGLSHILAKELASEAIRIDSHKFNVYLTTIK